MLASRVTACGDRPQEFLCQTPCLVPGDTAGTANHHALRRLAPSIAGAVVYRKVLAPVGAIKSPQIIEFLKHLMRHVPGPLLVVWEGLPSHRSGVVREFVDATEGVLVLERLPAYAPELNPVESLWGYWKHHELPNFCARDGTLLNSATTLAAPFQRMRRMPRLVTAFWKQASLF